ncbi:MAG: CHAT domain-containing protein, partial [Cyclobacteriaceae bacterium]
ALQTALGYKAAAHNEVTDKLDKIEKKLLNAKDISASIESYKSWKEVEKSLRPGEAIISFMSFEHTDQQEYYGAFLLENGSKPRFLRLGKKQYLDRLFENYLSQLKKRKFESILNNTYNSRIYSEVMSPLLSRFGDKTDHLLIVNDGIFSKVNLGVIMDRQTESYLFEKYHILYVNSLKSKIESTLPTKRKRKNIVLVGNPSYGKGQSVFGKKWSALPGTAEEIQKVRSAFKNTKWKTIVLDEDEASEQNLFTLSSPSILHIASHGFFISSSNIDTKNSDPLVQGGIVLAHANDTQNLWGNNDGYLTAYELMQLKLDRTELIVFSACDTGLGEEIRGEGINGLQRSALSSGANSLVMSLWEANDYFAQQWIRYFYLNYLNGVDTSAISSKTYSDFLSFLPEESREIRFNPGAWGNFIFSK